MLASRTVLNSGIMSRKVLPSLNLDFTGTAIPSGVSVARSVPSPYLTRSGLYAFAPANTARLDCTAAGVPRGLLVETIGANYVPYSCSLTNSVWTGIAATAVAGAPSSDGTSTSFYIRPSTANTWHDVRQGNFSYATKYAVVSAIVKASGMRYFTIGVTNSLNSWQAEASVVIDTTTGTVSNKSSTNYVINSKGSVNLGNSYWIVWANIDVSYSAVTGIFFTPTPQASGVTGSWAGDGVSGAIVTGVMLEPAMTSTQAASSMISTGATSLQRPPELVTFTIPANVRSLLYTFDDSSTQIVYVQPGSYTIPLNMCKGRRIKTIAAAADNTSIPSIFLETDMAADVEDMLSLQMLLAEASAGKCRIIGVNANTFNQYSAPTIAAVLKHCGYGHIPVGAYKGSEGTTESGASVFAQQVAARFGTAGDTRANYADGKNLLRSVLAAQPDASVTILSIGLFQNIRDLFASAADAYSPLSGMDLVTAKVSKFVIMGGYATTGTEWNFQQLPSATAAVINNIPNTIPAYYVDFNLGNSVVVNLPTLGDQQVNPFVYGVALSGFTSRQTWDTLTTMFATGGTYFADFNIAEANGTNTVNASTGANTWSSTPGNDNYLGLAVSTATAAAHISAGLYQTV